MPESRLAGRLRADAALRWGLVGTAFWLVTALLGPLILAGEPSVIGPAELRLVAPSWAHPLGTDALGRDVLQRLVHGARVSLAVGGVSVLVAVLAGTLVGLAAGLGPRWLESVLMRATDVLLAFPRIFLVLLLVALSRPSLLLVMVVLGLTGWMPVARLVRGEVLALREREFVTAARGLGLTSLQVAWRHLLPNLLPLLALTAALRVGEAVLMEAFLSFLGLGAQEPTVSWGAMIEQGRPFLVEGWWIATFPGLALVAAVVSFNLLGDGLRDLWDPRTADRTPPRETVT
ncbi:MAG: ABC transporter permease [Candidatus Krumholzibacteriia bacterium]